MKTKLKLEKLIKNWIEKYPVNCLSLGLGLVLFILILIALSGAGRHFFYCGRKATTLNN